jgi:hypothetical protein
MPLVPPTSVFRRTPGSASTPGPFPGKRTFKGTLGAEEDRPLLSLRRASISELLRHSCRFGLGSFLRSRYRWRSCYTCHVG